MITEVFRGEATHSRGAYLKIEDDKVIFDDSDGPIEFDLELLEWKIKEHNESRKRKK